MNLQTIYDEIRDMAAKNGKLGIKDAMWQHKLDRLTAEKIFQDLERQKSCQVEQKFPLFGQTVLQPTKNTTPQK